MMDEVDMTTQLNRAAQRQFNVANGQPKALR